MGQRAAARERGSRGGRPQGGWAEQGREEVGSTPSFFGGLPLDSDEAQIQRVFQEFGSVVKTKVSL